MLSLWKKNQFKAEDNLPKRWWFSLKHQHSYWIGRYRSKCMIHHYGGMKIELPQWILRRCKGCMVSCPVILKDNTLCSVGAEVMWGLLAPGSRGTRQWRRWIVELRQTMAFLGKSVFLLLPWWSSWAAYFVTVLSNVVLFLWTSSMGHWRVNYSLSCLLSPATLQLWQEYHSCFTLFKKKF